MVTLDDARRAFVKVGSGLLAGANRHEARVLRWLEERGAAQLAPRLLDFIDGDPATLVLEDLGYGNWPPPYPARTDDLFDTLAELAEVEAPADLDRLEAWADGSVSRWERVALDPAAFLALGVCSAAWFDRDLRALIEAEKRIELQGTALVHNDVYAANICFMNGRVVLVDWAAAVGGNPELDVAFAIVSVLAEGGRLPERRLLDDESAWASRMAGHNAVAATLPLPEWADPASTLRQDQLFDLRVALLWAARALEIPEPQ